MKKKITDKIEKYFTMRIPRFTNGEEFYKTKIPHFHSMLTMEEGGLYL